jgi:arylsulfatase A
MRCALLIALLGAPVAICGAETKPAKQPNIIVIMADDMGAKELGCYGNAKHRTPVLDRLAKTGVKFETAFSTPVCHPTRFMIMTGQYGHRTGIYNFAGKRGGPDPDDPAENIANHLTFGKVLKDAGYATAVAGKWQLSGSYPNLIRETGFDEYCMWGFAGYYSPEDRQRVKEAGIDYRSRYWHPSVIRNGKWVPTTEEDYGPDIYSAFILDFIQRNKDKPFFVYYPMCLPHSPWNPTPDTIKTAVSIGKRDHRSPENYKANVEYIDKIIGRLVAELDRLGLRDNTVLFFTADNGTGGDGKSEATELGARVPMIVNGPGIVKARGSTKELTDLSDIFPTIVELTGAKLPAGHPVDGRSYAPFLRGKTDSTRDWIYAFQADRRVLRTQRWLLEDNSPFGWGRLYDCGDKRDGNGYKEVTSSTAPEVAAIKARFNALIKDLPVPLLDEDGAPNDPKIGKDQKREQKAARNRDTRR